GAEGGGWGAGGAGRGRGVRGGGAEDAGGRGVGAGFVLGAEIEQADDVRRRLAVALEPEVDLPLAVELVGDGLVLVTVQGDVALELDGGRLPAALGPEPAGVHPGDGSPLAAVVQQRQF